MSIVKARPVDGAAPTDVEARLRAGLLEAIGTRDVVAAFALRSALSAIGNAGADPADSSEIVRAEAAERASAAGQCEHAGYPDRAERLRREASILLAVLGETR